MSNLGRESSQRGLTTAPAIDPAESHRNHGTRYKPGVYDLAHAFSNLNRQTLNIDIPPIFLQAASVDTARIIGQGASFTASVRSLPPRQGETLHVVFAGGARPIGTFRAAPRPKCIVYKVARIAFDRAGNPLSGDERTLQNVLTELHALTYPTLYYHPNIVALLGLAWGSNEFDARHRLPALVVEYAEHGTLAHDRPKQEAFTNPLVAQSFCFDIANALTAIHAAGVIHGDVKAENVLICQGSRRMVAKLADFGFSVVSEAERGQVWLGGTRPWKAPETARPIDIGNLPYTDVYSFGLLIWTLSVGGVNPFALVLEDPCEESIENLKQSDRVLSASHTATWISKFGTGLVKQHLSDAQGRSHPHTLMFERLARLSKDREHVTPGIASDVSAQALSIIGSRFALISKLDQILPRCLGLQPESRNLEEVVNILRPGVIPAEPHFSRSADIPGEAYAVEFDEENVVRRREYPSHQTGGLRMEFASGTVRMEHIPRSGPPRAAAAMLAEHLTWTRRGYKRRWLSWQTMGQLSPGMQELVHGAMTSMTDEPSRFLLAAAYMNGYACSHDVSKALELLRACADGGYRYAQAYLYRLHRAAGVNHVPGFDLTKYLYDMACFGSRAARLDLRDAGLDEQAQAADSMVTRCFGGVGANWFADVNMLHGLLLKDYFNHDLFLDVAKNIGHVNEYRVNRHGDTLLHMAASYGGYKSYKYLVDESDADVNCRNRAGDTPLISLCRAGMGPSAIVFLQDFMAVASLAAHNGETALHWLISFPDPTIEPLARDLLARGANLEAMTKERVSHSMFEGTIDYDFQLPGTPLQWAVHHNRPVIVKVLLALGANAEHKTPDGHDSILRTAAYYHHAECLEILIAHLERIHGSASKDEANKSRFAVWYRTLLNRAIHAADPFSMMIRSGHRFRDQLYATLDLIRTKTQHYSLDQDFGYEGWTPFYFAVAGGHDDVVRYMIEKRWYFDGLNQACGAAKRTPLLEAVRWNRLSLVKLLVENGADVHARSCSPFDPNILNRSALHILAEEGLQDDRGMLDFLVASGLRVDGVANDPTATDLPALQNLTIHPRTHLAQDAMRIGESAFDCALRNNSFRMCDKLLQYGADVNSLSLTAGLTATLHPTTILGHMIVSNARYTYDRLKYLLRVTQLQFVVEPTRQLTALHRAAMAHVDTTEVSGKKTNREAFDWDTNQAILTQLISKYGSPENLNARSTIQRRTALHLAVDCRNVGAVQTLLAAGADHTLQDQNGNRPGDLLVNVDGEMDDSSQTIAALLLSILD